MKKKIGHTPGPWTVSDNLRIGNGFDFDVCQILVGGNKEEDAANTCLIATAPELLEASKELLEYLDCGDDIRNVEAAKLMLRNAIIKAEGGK